MQKKISETTSTHLEQDNSVNNLLSDIRAMVEKARQHVANEYNSTHTLLCWLIGKRINEEILDSERAEYGETVISLLAKQLTQRYGRGYSRPNLFRMIKFTKQFPNKETVSTLSRQLSWSHFILLCSIQNNLERDFYVEMSRVQKWSVHTLQKQIKSMLYERVGLSKMPESTIKSQLAELKLSDKMTPELIFKELYFSFTH